MNPHLTCCRQLAFFDAKSQRWRQTTSTLSANFAGYRLFASNDADTLFAVMPDGETIWCLALRIDPSNPLSSTTLNYTITSPGISDTSMLPPWFWTEPGSTAYDLKRQLIYVNVSGIRACGSGVALTQAHAPRPTTTELVIPNTRCGRLI